MATCEHCEKDFERGETYMQRRYRAEPEFRAKKKDQAIAWQQATILKAVVGYGGVCLFCGRADREKLTVKTPEHRMFKRLSLVTALIKADFPVGQAVVTCRQRNHLYVGEPNPSL